MKIFPVTKIVQMSPIGTNKFATTYYRQSKAGYAETAEFIKTVLTEVLEVALDDDEIAEFLDQSLKKFPKTKGQDNYSTLEVISDMYGQYQSGKDCPSGMLSRWHRLFEGTEYDFGFEGE